MPLLSTLLVLALGPALAAAPAAPATPAAPPTPGSLTAQMSMLLEDQD
jgi:hypothetical protein